MTWREMIRWLNRCAPFWKPHRLLGWKPRSCRIQQVRRPRDRLLRARLWKLYDEGSLFGRLRGGRGGAVEYMKELYMQQLELQDRPDLGVRWPPRLVATAAEEHLSFRHIAHVVCGSQRLPERVKA